MISLRIVNMKFPSSVRVLNRITKPERFMVVLRFRRDLFV